MIHDGQRQSYDSNEQSSGHDRRSSEDHGRNSHSSHNGSRTNGTGNNSGYSVASTHDYLGYSKSEQPFDQQGGISWDDDKMIGGAAN